MLKGFAGIVLVASVIASVPGNVEPPSADARSLADRSGEIRGIVRVPAASPPPDVRLSPYSRQSYGPSRFEASSFDPRDVVVFVTTRSGSITSPPADVVVDQVDLKIVQRVTPVVVGTTVEFPNSDGVFHNLFSLSSPQKFNLGRYAPGDTRSVTFNTPGVVRLFCDIHSDMGGAILVLETDRFTRPSADGAFRFAGLEAGRHQVVAWHDALGADTTEVLVTDDGVAEVVFSLR